MSLWGTYDTNTNEHEHFVRLALFDESSCAPTVHVQLQIREDGKWFLQALGRLGKSKAVGGDEFNPVFTDYSLQKRNPQYGRNIPSAIVYVTDNGDGIVEANYSFVSICSLF